MSKTKDTIYAAPMDLVDAFCFDEHVVAVFDDMMQRSVPSYAEFLKCVHMVASQLPDNAIVYDLGCSLGSASLQVLAAAGERGVQMHSVDAAAAMLQRLEQRLRGHQYAQHIELIHADMQSLDFKDADCIILGYTLQFLPIDQRDALIQAIYSALRSKNGHLLLAEKTKSSAKVQALYEKFKQLNGYSTLEIAQKHQALANVLYPESKQQHQHRLQQAGFSQQYIMLQMLQFVLWHAQPT